MNKYVAVSIILLPLVIGSCSNLGSSEKEFLNELRSLGVDDEDQTIKNVPLAGALNILPGFGNFYLAYGTTETDQWLVGGFNLFLWPLSIVWGVPEATIDASTINKKSTAYYYQYDKTGKMKLAKLRAQRGQYAQGKPQQQAYSQPQQQSNLRRFSVPVNLPIFASTDVNSPVLHNLQNGSILTVEAMLQNGWVRVASNRANSPPGYVHFGWGMDWKNNVAVYASPTGGTQVATLSPGAKSVIFLVAGMPGWYKIKDSNSAQYKELFVYIPGLAGAERAS